jgi:translocator protein
MPKTLRAVTHRHPLLSSALSISVAEAAGLVGVPFTRSAQSWYDELRKPSFAPPGAIFGPVWTLLYGLMGIAVWLVLRENESPERTQAISLYAGQLVLNATWTPIFFGARRPTLAFVEILALWIAVVATVVAFARVRRTAALLLLPYLAWSTFATVLNGAIARSN